MLVRCPCGKKLKVKDSLLGKKVRCPTCQKVFVAEEGGEAEEGIVTEKILKKIRLDADAEDGEDEDEDDTESSGDHRDKGGKSGGGLWRNLIGGVVLAAALIVLGVVLWKRLTQTGTVGLEINTAQAKVYVDGKPFEDPNLDKTGSGKLELSPGKHEIKVVKDGFQTVTKEVDVQSGQFETISVMLQGNKKGPR